MANEVDIVVLDDHNKIKVLGTGGTAASEHLLRDALRDIADRIQEEAVFLAPHGETGDLKEHPTDRRDVFGEIEDRSFSFGGGFSVRGAGGRFVGKSELSSGTSSHIVITVAKNPKHAIWVHEGTGLFGKHNTYIVPRHAKFMVFTIGSKKFRMKRVKGQEPQPYLTEAYRIVDATYVPERVERLRLEIDALLS